VDSSLPPRCLPLLCAVLGGLLAASAGGRAAALDPERLPSQYVHRAWSLDDGLPQTSVNDVVQDRDGYLWLATYGGLARFDGVHFQVFTQADHPGLPSDRLLSLEEDDQGDLWIGTERSGLALLRDGQILRFEPPDGLSLGGVTAFHRGLSSGSLWIGTNHGLVHLGAAGWRRFGAAQGLPEVLVTSILETPEGDLWVGTVDGLWRRQGDRFVAALEAWVARGATVSALYRSASGDVWIGASRRLLRWSPDRGEVTVADLGREDARVQAILQDRDGNLWIGLEPGGLVRLGRHGVEAYQPSDDPTVPRVSTLFEDREGNLWIGTRESGLHQLTSGAAISYGGAGSPLHASVVPIVSDGAGGIWAGLNCGGLAHLDGARRVRRYAEAEGLTNTCVWSLLRDGAGRLWIGTMGGGLFTLQGDRVVSVAGPPTPGRIVRALLQGRRSDLLAGSDDGVFRIVGSGGALDRERLAKLRFDPLPGTAGLHVLHLSEDADGALWIGAEGGLFVYRAASGAALPVAAELTGVQVRSVYHDAAGVAWIGTYGDGLYRFDGGHLSRIGQRQGLPENVVSLIVEDDRQRFWLTGNRGVYRVPRSSLEAVVQGRAPHVEAMRYGAGDGMLSSECNGGGQPAGLLTAGGELWVPTLDGVSLLDTRDTAPNPAPPPVLIESVTLDGVAVDPRRPAVFAAGARNLEIRYTALSFADPRRVRFRYRLQGRDERWFEAGGRRVAYYPFLPPGENRFDVIAANADGVWNPQGASFTFAVRPRLTDTPAPWVLLPVLVLFLASGAVWLRLRAVRRREQRLAADVAARTAELREAQARLEAANRRLDRLARLDALTGIPNRRSLMERLDAEWRRAVRRRRPLGLLMIDIDFFKRYNDLHGHPAGDECLRQVTSLLSNGLRRADEMLARYGGEELAAVVPETSAAELADLAERLRQCVAEARIPHGDSTVAPWVTVSIGGAIAVPAAWDSQERLAAAADSALYQAKRAGRNRVEIVDLTSPPVEA